MVSQEGQSRPTALSNLSPAVKSKSVGRNLALALPTVQLGGTINRQSPKPRPDRWERRQQTMFFYEEVAGCARSVLIIANTARYGPAPGESIIVQSRTSSGERASSCHFIELLKYAGLRQGKSQGMGKLTRSSPLDRDNDDCRLVLTPSSRVLP
jgi:hypothetical protein